MDTPTPSSLCTDALERRLRELTSHQHNAQGTFLLHLDEFDRRRAFLEAGFGSLWDYCLRALHLREGPAGRRIGAMRVLRRFPMLERPLRDGSLCLSTVTVMGPLLTTENLDDLVARAAYRTKAEVEHLVATLQPRSAPREGLRKTSERRQQACEPPMAFHSAQTSDAPANAPAGEPGPLDTALESAPASASVVATPREDRRVAEMRPVSKDQWSLRVTVDSAMKADLEMLTSLLSHTTGGDLASVLHEAIRCGIEKHGRRKGAMKPARERLPRPRGDGERAPTARAVPAKVRRQVWERDGGCCAWTSKDGRRCGSRWKLELDHIVPVALGGSSTLENLRLACRQHNVLHAEHVFGRGYMATFRARSLSQDEQARDRPAMMPTHCEHHARATIAPG